MWRKCSLDDIAREAGFGAGTLYRHFPALDAHLEAVCRTEVEKLAAAEWKLAETMPQSKHYGHGCCCSFDYIATKKIIDPALNTPVGGPSKMIEASCAQIWEAIRAVVKRAIKNGNIRKDLDPIDLLRALIGVAVLRLALTGSKASGDWWISF
jgi:AcrR family transcriptional regulator